MPGLKSALVAALATVNSTVWLLAGSLSTWCLVMASIASIAIFVGWLVVESDLWDRPEEDFGPIHDDCGTAAWLFLVPVTRRGGFGVGT